MFDASFLTSHIKRQLERISLPQYGNFAIYPLGVNRPESHSTLLYQAVQTTGKHYKQQVGYYKHFN